MKRDCLIGYYASMLIFGRLMVSSDPFEVQVLFLFLFLYCTLQLLYFSGLRIVEMECDCLIAHGASMLIFECLMVLSHPFEVQVLFLFLLMCCTFQLHACELVLQQMKQKHFFIFMYVRSSVAQLLEALFPSSY